jgi:hypothetical protein
MDSMTHIYFAANLLKVARLDQRAVACSLFPQIDRTPAYYHRLYAHSIAKAAPIVAASRDVYWSSNASPDETSYFQTRLYEDKDRIQRYVVASPYYVDDATVPSDLSMRLSFVSHLYNDQFNNPIQAFVPYSVYPSGAWNLWESIDAAEFRWYLYERAAIDDFRSETFAGSEWNAVNDGEALIAAMITRLAKASAVSIEQQAVDAAMRSVGVADAVGTIEHKEAVELLQEHDERVCALIRKFSEPRDITGLRYWAGHGY